MPERSLRRAAILFALCSATVVVAIYGWIGLYSRYLADEIGFAIMVRHHGFWPAQVAWYTSWHGRYTASFLSSVLALFESRETPAVTLVVLALWMAAATNAARAAFRFLGIAPDRWAPAAAGVTFVAVCVHGAPDVFQAFLWQSGVVAYTIPLVAFTWESGRVLDAAARPGGGWWRTAAEPAVVGLLAGACSETIALCATIACSVMIIVAPPRLRRSIAACLAGCVLAFLIVAAAPGNGSRRAGFEPVETSLPRQVLTAGQRTLGFVETVVRKDLLLLSTAALLVIAVVPPVRRRTGRPWLVAAATGIAAAAASFAITFVIVHINYSNVGLPPGRALMVPYFLWVVFACASGFALAQLLTSPRSRATACAAALLSVLIAGPIAAINAAQRIAPARALATRLDAIDAQLRRTRASDVTIAAPHYISGVPYITESPTSWANIAVAHYYGFRTIRAVPEDAPPR